MVTGTGHRIIVESGDLLNVLGGLVVSYWGVSHVSVSMEVSIGMIIEMQDLGHPSFIHPTKMVPSYLQSFCFLSCLLKNCALDRVSEIEDWASQTINHCLGLVGGN